MSKMILLNLPVRNLVASTKFYEALGGTVALPIAGVSTGTNNAFPEMREPTITGLAAGLFATGRIALSARSGVPMHATKAATVARIARCCTPRSLATSRRRRAAAAHELER